MSVHSSTVKAYYQECELTLHFIFFFFSPLMFVFCQIQHLLYRTEGLFYCPVCCLTWWNNISFFLFFFLCLLLVKLEVVRELLMESLQSEDRLEFLLYSAIYLKVFFDTLFLLLPSSWYLHALLRSFSYAVGKHWANSLLWRWRSSPAKQACWDFRAYISWIGTNFL